jgi:hypothetical protein
MNKTNLKVKQMQAEPAAKKAPAAAPPAGEVPTATAAPSTELPAFMELLAELCADILLNGYIPDQDHLLRVLATYHERRSTGNFGPDRGNVLRDRVTEKLNSWKRMLLQSQPPSRPSAPKEKNAAKESVTQMIRSSVRHEVCGKFQYFLQGGSPEEVRLLNDVFQYWQDNHSLEFGGDEVVLATAFGLAIDEKHPNYFRIPDSQRSALRNFLMVVGFESEMSFRRGVKAAEEAA